MPAATHYVTAYTGKVQPHVTSLRFLCLVWMLILMRKPALLQLPRTPAASAQASCRRLLMHMASTCHKRRHRSMQEMVDFVLGFPEAICTRSFRRLYISGALAQAAAELQVDTAVGKLPRSFSVSGLVAPGPAQDTSTQTTAPRASAASVDRVVFLANFLITNTAALLCVSGAGISTSRAWSVSQHKREINRKCLSLQQLIHTHVSGRRGSSVVLPGECRNSWGQPFLRQTPTQNVVRSCS